MPSMRCEAGRQTQMVREGWATYVGAWRTQSGSRQRAVRSKLILRSSSRRPMTRWWPTHGTTASAASRRRLLQRPLLLAGLCRLSKRQWQPTRLHIEQLYLGCARALVGEYIRSLGMSIMPSLRCRTYCGLCPVTKRATGS